MAFDPQTRGYCAVYREGERNRCPGCGREQWSIGRAMAECVFCSTALPLADSTGGGERRTIIMKRGKGGVWKTETR